MGTGLDLNKFYRVPILIFSLISRQRKNLVKYYINALIFPGMHIPELEMTEEMMEELGSIMDDKENILQR